MTPERNALMCSGLSAETTDTIINSRTPSTRCLYALKWKFYILVVTVLDPVHCPIGSVLEFVCSVHICRTCTRRRCFSESSSFGITFYARFEMA